MYSDIVYKARIFQYLTRYQTLQERIDQIHEYDHIGLKLGEFLVYNYDMIHKNNLQSNLKQHVYFKSITWRLIVACVK